MLTDEDERKAKKKAYSAKYYAANREHTKATRAKWRMDNPKRAKTTRAKYRAENPAKVKAIQARGYAKNSERATDYRRKHHYGLSSFDFNRLQDTQGFTCKICGGVDLDPKAQETKYPGRAKTINVDHHHVTWKVRGLLCRSCNHGLGNFRDSIATMQAGIQYLLDNLPRAVA